MRFARKTFRTLRPFSNTVTRCKFGRKDRFVARNEKLRLCPKVVVLPQFSHFAMTNHPFNLTCSTTLNNTRQAGILPQSASFYNQHCSTS